jgi:hypothetical protein
MWPTTNSRSEMDCRVKPGNDAVGQRAATPLDVIRGLDLDKPGHDVQRPVRGTN